MRADKDGDNTAHLLIKNTNFFQITILQKANNQRQTKNLYFTFQFLFYTVRKGGEHRKRTTKTTGEKQISITPKAYKYNDCEAISKGNMEARADVQRSGEKDAQPKRAGLVTLGAYQQTSSNAASVQRSLVHAFRPVALVPVEGRPPEQPSARVRCEVVPVLDEDK